MNRILYDDRKITEKGFTLLELATAVGIVLVFVLVGLLSYRGLSGNAQQAAVEKAAEEVYNKAYIALIDEDPDTTPEAVISEYNLSQGNKKDIIAVLKRLNPTDERIKVTAIMGEYEAVRSTPSTSHEGNGDDGENTTKPIIPGENPDWTTFTYKCDEQESGYLPIVNISEGTKVYMWEKNDKMGTFEEIEYRAPNTAEIASGDKFIRDAAREEIYRTQLYNELGDWGKVVEVAGDWGPTTTNADNYTVDKVIKNVGYIDLMKAGVEYSVRYDGDVETFTSPGANSMDKGDSGLSKCLRSVDNMGNSTNLQNIVYIGTAALEKVPDSIPSTVVTLRGAFENTTDFNDPNVAQWDVSNVKTMRSMFYNATGFNQDLSAWDTSELINTQMMFYNTVKFNQNLNGWDTSELTYAGNMFQRSSFNNGCADNDTSCPLKWETDKLLQVTGLFSYSKFNQNVSETTENGTTYWNMANLSNINSMFLNNTVFNNGDEPLASNKPLNWTFASEITMQRTFDGAESFNQDLSTWDLSKTTITARGNFSRNSGLLCSHIPAELYTATQCRKT